MRDVVDLVVTQVADGEIRWEDWWVSRNGHARHDIPTFDDYLGFIDFDLSQNGLPRLTRVGERIVLKRVPAAKVAVAQQVVSYHGFRADLVT